MKKTVAFFLFFCLVSALFSTTPLVCGQAVENVINGGFETGDLTSWVLISGSPVVVSDSYSGDYALQLNYSAPYTQVMQSFEADIPASSVTALSFWFKYPSAFWSGLFGVITDGDGAVFQLPPSTADWTYYNVTAQEGFLDMVTNGENIQAIYFNLDFDYVMLVDDVSLIAGTEPTPTPTATPTPTPTIPAPTHSLPTYVVEWFYFHDTTVTVNDESGYLASEYQPNSEEYDEGTIGGYGYNVSYGVRVYLVGNRSTTELTSGEPEAIATTDDSSGDVLTLSATWTLPQTSLAFGRDALKFVVYRSFSGGDWSAVAIFVTEHLFYSKIYESQVTFTYFVDLYEFDDTTFSTFYWGGGDYDRLSGAANFNFKEATPPEWQSYYLRDQNFIMFVFAPYVVVLGNTFYGIILLAFCMGLYIRYRQISPVVLFILLIAGTLTAGGVNIAFGEYVVGLIWAVCAFGLALIYWRVFR